MLKRRKGRKGDAGEKRTNRFLRDRTARNFPHPLALHRNAAQISTVTKLRTVSNLRKTKAVLSLLAKDYRRYAKNFENRRFLSRNTGELALL